MIFGDGRLVYDSDTWYSCDKWLCDVFGVHYSSKDVFVSYLILKNRGIEFNLFDGGLRKLVLPVGSRVRLSDFSSKILDNSICVADEQSKAYAVLDDKLTRISVSSIAHNSIVLDLTEVTNPKILSDMYLYDGEIKDRFDRQALYECEAFINNGIYTDYDFNKACYDFYWSRNQGTWERESKSFSTRIRESMIDTKILKAIPGYSDAQLIELVSDIHLSLRLGTNLLTNYIVAGGKVNKYVRAYLATLRESVRAL